MTEESEKLAFSAVPPAALDIVWPAAAGLLAPAVEFSKGRYTLEQMWQDLQKQDLALWLVLDGTNPIAAMTTRILQYPACRVLGMEWIGGERMEEWLPQAQETLASYGRDHDCDQLEGYGRKGWERPLKKLGWSSDAAIYRLELADG